MKTKAELLAAAEALEEAAERCQVEHDGYEAPRAGWNMLNAVDCEYAGYQRACNELAAKFLADAAELRAQAAAAGASMTEPVAWIRYCSNGGLEGPIMHASMEMARIESGAWTPLYAHPAPAPAEPKHYPHTWDETGERCKVCGDKDWMPGGCQPSAEHTAADAPSSNAGNLQALKAAKEPSAAGVPDVAEMSAWIKRYAFGVSDPIVERKLVESATALAAMQSQTDNFHMEYRMKCDVETKQQAEHINVLKAKLAEAVGLLAVVAETTQSFKKLDRRAFNEKYRAFLEKASEVMG